MNTDPRAVQALTDALRAARDYLVKVEGVSGAMMIRDGIPAELFRKIDDALAAGPDVQALEPPQAPAGSDGALRITRLKRGAFDRAHIVYGRLVGADGTLLISATLDYIVGELASGRFDAELARSNVTGPGTSQATGKEG